jgi:hypothetical protein
MVSVVRAYIYFPLLTVRNGGEPCGQEKDSSLVHLYISLASRKAAKPSCREEGNDPKRNGYRVGRDKGHSLT